MNKLAYLILAHTDVDHLKKLIFSIDYKADFYIHIDKKADITQFKKKISKSNIIFIEKRVSISWGGISMIDAEMNLISEVLKKNKEYSHAILLSGACYPIKSKEHIFNYFNRQPEMDFIKFIDMRESPNHYMKQISYKWFRESYISSQKKSLKFIDLFIRYVLRKLKLKNDWNNKIVPYFGSQWCALSMNSWNEVYNFHKNNPSFRKMNLNTFSPDEHYIHTIVGNSKNFDLEKHLMPFEGRGTFRMANYHIIDQSLSKLFTQDDWEEISHSDKLFVRKVDSKSGNLLVKKIKNEILDLNSQFKL